MNLEKLCKYIVMSRYMGHFQTQQLEVVVAENYENWKDNPVIVEFVEKMFAESDLGTVSDNLDVWATPVAERKWTRMYDRPSYYYPTETPSNCTSLYDGYDHYIYIESEVEGRWGDTYWISDNGLNSLEALPTIKAFQEFDFEVGKFYHVRCTDTIHWGNGKRKYVFGVLEECTEEEYLTKGYLARAEFESFYTNNVLCKEDEINNEHLTPRV